MKIITFNICLECKCSDPYKELSKHSADIIMLQEIKKVDIVKLAHKLNMNILNIDHNEETSILINKTYKIKGNNHFEYKKKLFYIQNAHLTDIPSVLHHINKIPYGIPTSTPLNKVFKLCEVRANAIHQYIKESKSADFAIIGGDFNEPSHIDFKLPLPTSLLLQKNKFIDSYRAVNKDDGFTWPSNKYYAKEPMQRIDFIYVRGLTPKKSTTHETFSDHKLLKTLVSM